MIRVYYLAHHIWIDKIQIILYQVIKKTVKNKVQRIYPQYYIHIEKIHNNKLKSKIKIIKHMIIKPYKNINLPKNHPYI